MAQNLHLHEMDEPVCVSKLWCLVAALVWCDGIFHIFCLVTKSEHSPSILPHRTNLHVTSREKKRFLLCLCLKSPGESTGAGSFILRDGELKSKEHQKGGAQPWMGLFGLRSGELCRYSGTREVLHTHTPVFVCSLPENNFIKLPTAWYLSEWVCVGFLEGHSVILMQLKNRNMG